MLRVGEHVGDYIIQEQIGRGGMGVVYRAQHRDGPLAAIKVLRSDLELGPRAMQRFVREAHILQTIRHPNVVRCLDAGMLEGGPVYLVLEHLEGVSLSSLVGTAPLDVVWVVHLINQVARGLDAVHAQQIVHRDTNPSNVVLARDRPGRARAVIIDFGIAKLMTSIAGISAERVELGTLAYRSPEQDAHPQGVDHRADIYSLGGHELRAALRWGLPVARAQAGGHARGEASDSRARPAGAVGIADCRAGGGAPPRHGAEPAAPVPISGRSREAVRARLRR